METAQLVSLWRNLKTNRSTFESHWQELGDFFLPLKANITKIQSSGQKVSITLYDSTSLDSVNVFAAGLHSYLTNPSSRWFSLTLQNKNLLGDGEVKTWLKDVEERIFAALNSSNFNQQVHEAYIEFVTFGTAGLYCEEDFEDDVRFYSRPISEIFPIENERCRVDMIYRHFTYTARQAFERWGEQAPERVKDAYRGGKWEDPFEFLQVIRPRAKRDTSKKDSVNMPFESQYIDIQTSTSLSVGGYEEFPVFVPRFTKVGPDVYGYSQTMIALPDVKTLNSMTKTIMKGAQKMVDPWMIVPDDGLLMPFRTTPGAVNVKSAGSQDKVDVFEFRGNLPVGLEMQNQLRQQIRRALFVDLFLLLADQPKMTATEVNQRVMEKMLILGPILGRLMNELLDPLIGRVFSILARAGKLPPIPTALLDPETGEPTEDYKVEYISPLARAQKMAEAGAMQQFLSVVGQMAQMGPQVLDMIDSDKAAKSLADIYNVTPILRTDDEVKAIREGRAQAAQAQAEMAMMQQGATAFKDAAQGAKTGKEAVSGEQPIGA